MNARQRYYAELLATTTMTQVEAYERAGYAPCDKNAARLASNPEVVTLVAQLEAEQVELLEPEREAIHHLMANHATVDIIDATNPELGCVLPPQFWDDEFAVAVEVSELDEHTMPIEIKLIDRLQAADRLLRVLAGYVDHNSARWGKQPSDLPGIEIVMEES